MKLKHNSTSDELYERIRGKMNRVLQDPLVETGVMFDAKYIGSLEVPKPSSRVEIVAAMRRVRHEFKQRKTKKQKVTVNVSMEGVKIMLKVKQRKRNYYNDCFLLMYHPIHRIFYVSHDSQDLNVFSYIARESNSNTFRCNVFKACKKNKATMIVNAIGNAFELCHQISSEQNKFIGASTESANTNTFDSSRLLDQDRLSELSLKESSTNGKYHVKYLCELIEGQKLNLDSIRSRMSELEARLESENSARMSLQTHNQSLIEQNRDLLVHIQQLLNHINKLECSQNEMLCRHFQKKNSKFSFQNYVHDALTIPCAPWGVSKSPPSCESPDSGHKEMSSSDSASLTMHHEDDEILHSCLLDNIRKLKVNGEN